MGKKILNVIFYALTFVILFFGGAYIGITIHSLAIYNECKTEQRYNFGDFFVYAQDLTIYCKTTNGK